MNLHVINQQQPSDSVIQNLGVQFVAPFPPESGL